MTIDPESGLYMGEQVFLPIMPTLESDGAIRIQMTHDIHCLVRSKLHGMFAHANCRPKNMLRMASTLTGGRRSIRRLTVVMPRWRSYC